jgi:hypothetical protein
MQQRSFMLLIALVCAFAANAQTGGGTSTSPLNPVAEVFYFHFNARCTTCRTVESEARSDVESLYGGTVSFRAVNLDDDSNAVLAEKLEVSSQTLLIVKGDKKVNITNEGFLYAVSNPEKLKSIIKEKIDELLIP